MSHLEVEYSQAFVDRAANLSYQEVSAVFHLPLHEACVQLRVDESSLKKRCRQLNIPRWPYRKRCTLVKELETERTTAQTASNNTQSVSAPSILTKKQSKMFHCFSLLKNKAPSQIQLQSPFDGIHQPDAMKYEEINSPQSFSPPNSFGTHIPHGKSYWQDQKSPQYNTTAYPKGSPAWDDAQPPTPNTPNYNNNNNPHHGSYQQQGYQNSPHFPPSPFSHHQQHCVAPSSHYQQPPPSPFSQPSQPQSPFSPQYQQSPGPRPIQDSPFAPHQTPQPSFHDRYHAPTYTSSAMTHGYEPHSEYYRPKHYQQNSSHHQSHHPTIQHNAPQHQPHPSASHDQHSRQGSTLPSVHDLLAGINESEGRPYAPTPSKNWEQPRIQETYQVPYHLKEQGPRPTEYGIQHHQQTQRVPFGTKTENRERFSSFAEPISNYSQTYHY